MGLLYLPFLIILHKGKYSCGDFEASAVVILCWHRKILNSGLVVKKNIRYSLSRLPKAPEGQGLDRLYLIFKI